MGLFNGYLKEGPGVDKNERKKKGLFLYIDILVRKFFNLLKANCLYVLFSIPFLAVIFLFVAPWVMSCIGITSDALVEMVRETVQKNPEVTNVAQAEMQTASTWQFYLTMFFTLIIFNFFGSGPISAAYAYAARCFTRGEHTWLFSDGKDMVKENFKQSMGMFIINMLVLAVTFFAFYTYGNLQSDSGMMGKVAMFARPFTMLIVFLLAILNIFAYQIMVTYECSFKALIKNSMMIALAKLPLCIILTAIAGAVITATCYFIADIFIPIVIYMLLGLMFARFPLEFYAARVLEKNMKNLKRRERKNAAKITYLNEE